MKLLSRENFRQLRELLRETTPPPDQMALRLQTVERDVILPVKACFVLILAYNLFVSPWFDNVALPQTDAQRAVQRFFPVYLALSLVVAGVLLFRRKMPTGLVQRFIFASNFADGVFLAALVYMTGGVQSSLFWLFPALIVRNAMSCPLATPQLVLNFSFSLLYLAASLIDWFIARSTSDMEDVTRLPTDTMTGFPLETFLLRMFLLWLATAWCYAMQVLFEKHRRAVEEGQEYAMRQEQLRSAGRLAAKIAHQIKNPLGIINNAAYSMQRALQEGKPINPQQIEIIREEVERADQTITKLMGYSQLAEGRVERLALADEIDRAISQAVPAAAKYPVHVERDVAPDLPALLMQKGHLSEILVNLLQNAREAFVGGKGRIDIRALADMDQAVILTIADDGPGIPKARAEKIFQAYYTTKEKGTGLGLSIVKHNIELYGGTVRVESELGKGTCFTLQFPTRTIVRPHP
jgi:signal transduction histidine kinase